MGLHELLKMTAYAGSFLRRGLVHVNLQLLYDCNFRCRICDFWKDEYRGLRPMVLEQVSTLSERLARLGPQIVSLGGGEPLLHPDLVGIVRALARHHFPVMICNGWFVTPERARALWEAGIWEVSISIDYADEGRHDAQRGVPGAWRRGVEALRILNEQRTDPYQRVHMITVVMDDNLDDVEPLIRLSEDLGVTYLVTLYSDARGCKQGRAAAPGTTERLLELKRRHPAFVALRGYVGRFTRAIAEQGIGPCYAGRNLCNVDCQGEVALCIDRREDSVGNLLRDDPRVLRERLLEKHRTNPCRSCWTSCRGCIESLLYGPDRLGNLWDYWTMARAQPLVRATGPGAAAGA